MPNNKYSSDLVDLRSDTVTKPTAEMREAMYKAEVGDDVYQEDPTVNELQDYAAERFGKEAALFFPTGTQAGLCALLSHCQRGEEYICGQQSHHYKYEGGGAAVLGGIQPQPIEQDSSGIMPIEKIEAAIKPLDLHFVITKLICLENTFWGQSLALDYLAQVRSLADRYNLRHHLDGARIFNAALDLNCDVKDIASCFDSLTVCLSKGLSAPAGTMLLGEKDFIKQALRWRKTCGGGMRQVGILAAAGLLALKNSPSLLPADHDKARLLYKSLTNIERIQASVSTNMVFFKVAQEKCQKLQRALIEAGFLTSITKRTRLVFHKDVTKTATLKLADFLQRYFTAEDKEQ